MDARAYIEVPRKLFDVKGTPVMPGKPEKNTDRRCAACRLDTAYTKLEVHGGFEMLLCIDFIACNRRSGAVKR